MSSFLGYHVETSGQLETWPILGLKLPPAYVDPLLGVSTCIFSSSWLVVWSFTFIVRIEDEKFFLEIVFTCIVTGLVLAGDVHIGHASQGSTNQCYFSTITKNPWQSKDSCHRKARSCGRNL